ncbi:MAG: transcriptional regulator [Bacteroidetes bacterium]|nr:MAG: transcriptional regulator [Bacteroidota bacterium]
MVKYSRNQEFINEFGKNLRKIREQKKISQEELAYRADLQLSQIGRIERGTQNTSISMTYTIAKALDIHVKELFEFEVPEEK